MQSVKYEIDFADLMYEDDEFDEPSEDVEQRAKSSYEALIKCINKYGRVDMNYMCEISDIAVDKLISDLRGSAIFQDPEYFLSEKDWNPFDGWLLSHVYLCNNVREKLSIARLMNNRMRGCFEDNITALEKHLPSCAVLDEINVSLGATWIPVKIYTQFIKELLGLKKAPTVFYIDTLAMWKIICPYDAGSVVLNSYTYGTPDISAVKIIELTMNARTVKVYDYNILPNGNTEKTLNKNATLAATEKQKLIISEFDKWVRADEDRKIKLEECYNDKFTGFAISSYDGSFLEFPGLNPEVKFYSHQKNAIARIVLSVDNVLLGHEVGAGKSYEMIAGVHELFRMGISKKNLIVVPNNILGAMVDAHRYLYKDDKILAVFPKDFTPAKRNSVLLRIATEEFTAIYMSYSSFDMIVMSREFQIKKMENRIKRLKSSAANASCREEKRIIERRSEKLSEKLAELITKPDDSVYIPYDKLGITTLVVDEVHNYKNVPLETKTDNIVGMHSAGSKKCAEMFDKCSFTDRLIFATGTPLTNSIADLFVLQSYLQSDELKFREIDTFDMWINSFGERETNFEIDVDSSNLRPMTRFSTFHNLTELMCLFSTVCDFYRTDEKDNELPCFNGYIDVCVPRTSAQKEYIKSLAERTDKIRAHKVKKEEDNLLKVTIDGRKCALDIRLVDKFADGGTENKITAVAGNVFDLYNRYPGTCQIVFSDIGTPKSEFNVYDELQSVLVRMGIKQEEIAFVHDAKSEKARARVFADMNSGRLRVVIGSTAKLGVGVNVQEKLIALHHLSVPWRPSDMVQREGRIIRRGNTCSEVFIYRYITEGSFDSYSWQLLENKQRFINSFLSGTNTRRDSDDIVDSVLSYAEVKALAIGDPLIKKRVETSNRLERAKIASRTRSKQLLELRSIVSLAPSKISSMNEKLKAASRDKKYYKHNKTELPQSERISFGEELLTALSENVLQKTERFFDKYQGFEILLPENMLSDEPYVYVRGVSGVKYNVEMKTDKPLGCSMRIGRFLDRFDERMKEIKNEIKNIRRNVGKAQEEIEIGNVYAVLVETLADELEQIDSEIEKNREEK